MCVIRRAKTSADSESPNLVGGSTFMNKDARRRVDASALKPTCSARFRSTSLCLSTTRARTASAAPMDLLEAAIFLRSRSCGQNSDAGVTKGAAEM